MKKKSTGSDDSFRKNEGEARGEPDALQTFLKTQSKKCAAHHSKHTSEVLELIRKHRKT